MTANALLIALPDVTADLNAPMILVIWVLMSYLLATTVLVPSIGRVADMIGRKNLFVLGAAVFTVSSLLAGMSQSGTQLLINRIIQAVGGSLMMANSTAIVTDAFPRGELGMALGVNGMVLAIGSVLGPIIGGVLTTLMGWRWVFYINVPFGALVTAWALFQIRDVAPLPEGEHFDWPGAITFTAGMFFLLFALTEGGFEGWSSPVVIVSLLLAAVLLPLFVYIESRVEQPMLDLRLFQSRILVFAYSSNLMNGIARGAVMFLLIFYLLGIKGMDPFTASIYLAPFALTMMVMAPISGRWSDRHGSRVLSTVGLLITGIGLLGFTLFTRVDMSISEVVIWGAVVGVGSGIFNSPNTNTIMSVVPPERRGIAAGTRTMMNNAGSLLSIAMAFAILSSGLTPEAMNALFIGAQIGSKGILVDVFISDLRLAFFISFVISMVAAVISYMRGPTPVWGDTVAAPADETMICD
jgi:EmrB/QacA subfamily drug resistance transporter